jgi:broad specificity phosphatase PhoE
MGESSGPIYLCRHGETAWSLSGQHTGVTDLELTENGVRQAQALAQRLRGIQFAHVLSSPRLRSLQTCEALGLGDRVQIWPDLAEWDYGAYEGMTTAQIQRTVPSWTIFTHGAPQGESVADASSRADGVIAKLKQLEGSIILFSHGHFSRLLGARWIGLPPSGGANLDLGTAALCILGYVREAPALTLWNETWFQAVFQPRDDG